MSFFGDMAKGGVEGFGGAIKAAVSAFKADPTKLAELEQAIEQARLTYEASVIASVNATMQAEAKSEHWMQWSWRPTVGFTFSAAIINNYILYAYFAKYGMQQVTIPDELWTAMLVVLGAAAATRGWEKTESAKRP